MNSLCLFPPSRDGVVANTKTNKKQRETSDAQGQLVLPDELKKRLSDDAEKIKAKKVRFVHMT